MTRPNDTYIQRFTFVHPSELRLARVARLVRACLGHFEQLHTEPLPAPHVPDSDRVEHYSELSLTTPLKRLRVAPQNGRSAASSSRELLCSENGRFRDIGGTKFKEALLSYIIDFGITSIVFIWYPE